MKDAKSEPAVFATTRWTLIGHAAGGPQAQAVLGELLSIYWQPLYRYARRVGKSREDAEDLVQGFMERLIENESLRHPDPQKGRFRTFLLALFNHWMINEWKRGSREKRGGCSSHVPFDWQHAEAGVVHEPADARSPDVLYDREWALALLEATLNRLEETCRAEGGASAFGFLKPCLTADTARISYRELAASLGLSEGAARVAVHRLRKRYQELLREVIAETVGTSGDAEQEWQHLFRVFSA